MISGIFGKTKPINYVILLGLLFLLFGFFSFYGSNSALETTGLAHLVFVGLILSFTLLVIDFVVNRNQITSTNSYVALFFVLLAFLFPEAVTDTGAIGSNFFLVLACRRLISLRTLKNIKLKILDATLWVLAASVFYSWAILFMILVFIAIYFYEPKNIKNWLVPLVGVITFLLIWNALLILYQEEAFILAHYEFSVGHWENLIKNRNINTQLIIFVLLIGITGMAVFLKSGKLGLGRIINLRFVSIYFILSIAVVLLSLTQDDFPLLITFFPAAVFLGKYIEMIKRKNIKEMVLMLSVVGAFLVFLLEILMK